MEQHSQPNDEQQGEWSGSTDPQWDSSANPTEAAPETAPKSAAGREMLVQLQQMIDTIATQASPVMRDVAVKAAELAVVAGQKAGPLAYKAAEVTDSLGKRMAARSKDFADEMRRGPEEGGVAVDTETDTDVAQATGMADAPERSPEDDKDVPPATDSSAWS